MIMKPVLSDDLSSVGYESGTLHIRFNSGGLYKYTNVPQAIYDALMSAPSKGKYFRANIRGKYGDTRIG